MYLHSISITYIFIQYVDLWLSNYYKVISMHILKDFKNFAEAGLELFNPLTVLIGPNGSGKSNVIEAVELLSFIAQGRPLYEIGDIGKGGEFIEIRGGLQSCPRHGYDYFTLDFGAGLQSKALYYSVSIQVEPRPIIFEEKLLFDNTIIFQTLPRKKSSTSSDITVKYNNFARGPNPEISVAGNRSVLSQYVDFAKIQNKDKYNEYNVLNQAIMQYLKSSFIFDPQPKLMRNYERTGNTILARDGSNLSAVLYSLSEGPDEDKQKLERLLTWIRQLPDEPYRKIDFATTSYNDVIFGLSEGPDDNIIAAKLLSDGTLRSLAVLTALETVDENSRIVIEEFDNGLHPSRVHVLAEAIADCCKRRKLNILVTTHNPATLNALQPEQLDGVVLCAWDKDKQASNLIRLSELPRYDELTERGSLGDLVSQRIIDQYLTPKYEEEHNEKALEWLRSLP